MILARWTGTRVLGGIALALLVVGGLVGLATGVEHGQDGLDAAARAGLMVVPITLVWLAPLCCGAGAAMAMAQIMARGEHLGLEAAGLGPLRTGWVSAVAGLLVGTGAWWASEVIVPQTTPVEAQSTWVWLDQGAYRASDGVLIRIESGRFLAVEQLSDPDPAMLRAAQQLAQPRTATHAVLRAADTPPASVERHSRLARILACGALALLGWVPLARRASAQVGIVLAVGLSAQALDLILQALAAQGKLPSTVGAWAIPLVLAGLAGLSVRR